MKKDNSSLISRKVAEEETTGVGSSSSVAEETEDSVEDIGRRINLQQVYPTGMDVSFSDNRAAFSTTASSHQQPNMYHGAHSHLATHQMMDASHMGADMTHRGDLAPTTVSYTDKMAAIRGVSSREYASDPSIAQVETVVTRYVDHPVVEEKTIHVQKVVEAERRVPKYEVEYVDKIVDVPRIEYVDKIEEFQQEEVVTRQVPKVESRDKVIYHPKYVPIEKVKHVEKPVYVKGETITNEIKKVIDVPDESFKFVDKETPVVVAQRVNPVLCVDDRKSVQVELNRYTPKCVPVDVYIERPVYIGGMGEAGMTADAVHLPVPIGDHVSKVPAMSDYSSTKSGASMTPHYTMSTAEYNSWMLLLNKSSPDTRRLPFMTDRNGRFPFLPKGTVMRGSFVRA